MNVGIKKKEIPEMKAESDCNDNDCKLQSSLWYGWLLCMSYLADSFTENSAQVEIIQEIESKITLQFILIYSSYTYM